MSACVEPFDQLMQLNHRINQESWLNHPQSEGMCDWGKAKTEVQIKQQEKNHMTTRIPEALLLLESWNPESGWMRIGKDKRVESVSWIKFGVYLNCDLKNSCTLTWCWANVAGGLQKRLVLSPTWDAWNVVLSWWCFINCVGNYVRTSSTAPGMEWRRSVFETCQSICATVAEILSITQELSFMSIILLTLTKSIGTNFNIQGDSDGQKAGLGWLGLKKVPLVRPGGLPNQT